MKENLIIEFHIGGLSGNFGVVNEGKFDYKVSYWRFEWKFWC